MSLLLDALRRASANREDAKAGHYTVPRRVAEPEAPHAQSAEPGLETVAGPADELSLAPREDPTVAEEPPADGGGAADPPDAGHGDGEAEPSAGGRETLDPPSPPSAAGPPARATADALLAAGANRPTSRLPLVLGLSAAGVVAAASLAGGGWLWYQQSREQITSDLGAYQPSTARVEAAPEPAPAESAEELAFEDPAALTLADADTAAEPEQSTGSSEPQDEQDGTTPPPGDEPPHEAGEAELARADASTAASGQSAEATDARATTDPSPAASEPSGQADEPAATGQPGANGEAANAPTDEQQPTSDRPASAGRPSETDARAASTDADQRRPADHGNGESGAAETGASDGARRARPSIQVARGAPLAEALDIGYRSLREDKIAAAEAAYGRALQLEPENRDALLGAAAVHQRRGSPAAARQMYRRVLDAHPRDPYARAALTALDGGAPRRDETELKMLLREQPDAPPLHFALGNLYAAESRWSDARQAYMRASEAAPRDPDYAFNLAVALDHLGRREAAREHYRRALRLAAGTAPEFEPAAARRRLQQLR